MSACSSWRENMEGGNGPTVKGCRLDGCSGGCGRDRAELTNEHTGRVCLVVLLSVISKPCNQETRGGKSAQAVKRKSFNLG